MLYGTTDHDAGDAKLKTRMHLLLISPLCPRFLGDDQIASAGAIECPIQLGIKGNAVHLREFEFQST